VRSPRYLARGFEIAILAVCEPAVRSSSLRASNPWLEPGELPCFGEAMAFACCFARKTGWLGQTPRSPSQRVGRRSLRDRPRLPTLHLALLPSAFGQGALVADVASLPQLRRYARLKSAARDLASLTRWQSASSTPTRAAAGFSWTSPAASKPARRSFRITSLRFFSDSPDPTVNIVESSLIRFS